MEPPPLVHRDLFDRLLVAQAALGVYGCHGAETSQQAADLSSFGD